MMSHHWKPLPSPLDSSGSSGGFSPFPRPIGGGRQITKNPQSSSSAFQSFSGYGSGVGLGGGAPPSPRQNGFESIPNSSYGMGGSISRMVSENGYGYGSNGISPPSPRYNNTNDMGGSRYENGGGFDRSISTSNFDGMRMSAASYDRQMSMPNLSNGYGNHLSHHHQQQQQHHRNGYASGDYGNDFGRFDSRPSPPNSSVSTMKIGTWNETPPQQHQHQYHGNSGFGNSGSSNSAMNFEIGTFNIGNDSGASSSSNTFNSQSGNNIQGGPGIRETGIIEKLLVRDFGNFMIIKYLF